MIFESLWPLFFLAAVPVIIILYLLKPKGVDQLISSNLLWQKLLKNQQSKTFFEKFVHNILMYLQILIIALLIIALMSPFIRVDATGGGRKILLIDTSGSMQHVGASGKTRLEEAVKEACDYVRATENTSFSVVTVDATGVELLAVDITDANSLIPTLQKITCSDSSGNLTQAQGVLDTLMGDETENVADLLVYTDGAGAVDFENLHCTSEKELHVVGEAVANVANEYTVFTQREDGLYDVMVSMTNYSGEEVSFDIGLYDEGENLIALSQMHMAPSESTICLFEQIDWQGQTLSSRLSGFSFQEGSKDSLKEDNTSQAVKDRGNLMNGLLVGAGNTFIEKAYQAVTGDSIAKATTDATLEAEEESYNVVIYDVNQVPQAAKGNRLLFGDAYGESTEVLNNVVLQMSDCDLATGLSDFNIGVNTAYCFTLPEGAVSLLEYEGKCVGYYGEREGKKEVVVGFDIRESDFPLRAEFPVFLANAMIYLSDTSWLATNVYYAGEEIALQPWAEVDQTQFVRNPDKAGLYQVGNDIYKESYVVRFQTATESDGQAEAESVTAIGNLQLQKVKQTLRNVFIVCVLVLLIIEWIIYVRQMRYQGKFYLVLRSVVFLCVLLALFGVQIRLASSHTATIFIVDLSSSNEEHLGAMEAYLSDMVDKMPKGNSYGIVTFGKDTLTEQFVTSKKHYGGLMTLPEKTATNFEEAISKALTLIPQNANKRLVVLTDGKETRGDISRMAQALTASQTQLVTLLYEDEQTQDAYIDNVTLPAYLHPGDKYSINVLVESNYDTEAVIVLYNGSSQVASNAVHLNKGSNRFVFSEQVSTEAGGNAMESLRIQVQAQGDTCAENDTFSAYSVVEAPPKVLVISGQNTNVSSFASVLNAAGSDYSVVSALNAPDNIQDMLAYKSIILVDTYIDDLPIGFLENLETYVKDYGCGFVCCGGEDSFALGGYRDTVIETVLPVDMELRGVNEKPSMAMVMVIDRSGSMTGTTNKAGASNLDIAIKAATVAVDNLREEDYVGVLTFDDLYDWQVELTQADDKSAIKDDIRAIDDGGGTTIKPALQEAYQAISQSEASLKHVVLLTDGMGETTNFSDVIKAYSESGITLSTVAVGDGSDTALLERLAKNCGGRYYYSDVSSDIPKIFAQEVFLGGDSYIQNGEFTLAVQGGHELTTRLFTEGWPMIYGYIAATPKTASSCIITSAEKDDPILTVWQYGLGRTVAWNSDVTGEWSGALMGSEEFVQLWKRIVEYSAGNANMGEDSVEVVTTGEQTQVAYQTKDYDGKTEIWATMVGPEGETEEVKLNATAPGKYETKIATSQTGLYHFNIRRTEDGQIQSYVTTAAAVQYSDEYKFDVSTDSYLSFVEQYGSVITKDDNIWSNEITSSKGKRSLTNLLLGLAICLFLVDVAVRRFQYEPQWSLTGKYKGKWKDSAESMQSAKKQKTAEGHGAAEGYATTEEHGTAGNATAEGTGENQSTVASDKAVKKPRAAVRKKKQKEQSEQTLDTSQLLKKKDNRNI
ncbi:MAG: VWA domain-containing protein [Lachnospiraceae bacterium]|nr:VWA domain-containing protein [Lachnospiraceae bacterium]